MAPPLMGGGHRNRGRSIDDDDVEEPLMNQLSGLENMDRKASSQEDKSRVMKLVISFIAMVFFGLGNKVTCTVSPYHSL